MIRALVLGTLLVVPATAATAQSARFAAGAMAAAIRMQDPAVPDAITGSGGGIELGVGMGRVTLRLRYVEIPLDSVTARQRTLVEGEGLVTVAVTDWLWLGAGPHARTMIVGEDRIRRLQFEGRARAHAPIVPSRIWTFFELWAAPWSEINVPGGYQNGLGGTAGMSFAIPDTPIHARVAYRVDSGLLGGGVRRETIEGISLTIGIGLAGS